MIYTCRIGEVEVGIDDELTDERPTPEVVADYLTRIAQTTLGAWLALPDQPAHAAMDADDN